MADGQYYSNAQTLYDIFGEKNIRLYASPDNDADDEVINRRIDWANQLGQEYTNGRMAVGKYSIPFKCPVPKLIEIIAGSYAGKLLYDIRRIVDGEDDDAARIAAQTKNMNMLIQQILSGQLLLTDASCRRLPAANAYPISIGSDYKTEEQKANPHKCNPFLIDGECL